MQYILLRFLKRTELLHSLDDQYPRSVKDIPMTKMHDTMWYVLVLFHLQTSPSSPPATNLLLRVSSIRPCFAIRPSTTYNPTSPKTPCSEQFILGSPCGAQPLYQCRYWRESCFGEKACNHGCLRARCSKHRPLLAHGHRPSNEVIFKLDAGRTWLQTL